MVSLNRGRGILSESDRNYALNNEQWSKEKSRPAANQRREAIIERLRNSMLDFILLADEEFPEELLSQVFHLDQEYDLEKHGPLSLMQFGQLDLEQDPRIQEGCTAAIALIYRMYSPTIANTIIEEGVRQAVQAFYPEHKVVDASYNPDLRSPDRAHEQAKNRMEKGLRLREDDLRLLLEQQEVDPQRVASHVQEKNQQYVGMDKSRMRRRKEQPEYLKDDTQSDNEQ